MKKEKKPKKFTDDELRVKAKEIFEKLKIPETTENDVFKLFKAEYGT